MKKQILILATALACLTACDGMLDKEPKSKLSPETYFSNATEMQLFTNSFYNNLLPKEPYAEESDQFIDNNPSNYVRGGNNRTTPASGGGWSWGDLRKMNVALAYMSKNCKDQNVVNEYTGLVKFFRAYFYEDKVKRFGDVPWIDHELGSKDDSLYAPRDNREVVLTHMIEDLDEAIKYLPASYSNGHHYRVTKWAALALKSRICLYEGTYRKYHTEMSFQGNGPEYYLGLAADAAKELMEESGAKLYSTGKPNLDYAVLFSRYDEYPEEYILSINFDFGTQQFHNATGAALMNSQGIPSLTQKMANAYLMKDGSRFTDKKGWETMSFEEETKDRDPRLGQTVRIPGYSRMAENGGVYSYSGKTESPDFLATMTGYQMAKFVMPAGNQAKDKFGQSYNDLPVIRLAEVYLNYAEAKAELGTLTQEDLDISVNLLRDRVGMPHLNMAEANANPDPYLSAANMYPNVSGNNKGVILEIRRERGVELAQEGFRIDDLCRRKVLNHLAEDREGIYFPGKGFYDVDGDGTVDVVIWSGVKPTAKAHPEIEGAVLMELGNDIVLSNGDSGNWLPYDKYDFTFDENRDYLYPIPINELKLNPNLVQNPGWDTVGKDNDKE